MERAPLDQKAAQRTAATTTSSSSSGAVTHAVCALLDDATQDDAIGRMHVCPMGVDLPAPSNTRAVLRRDLGFTKFTSSRSAGSFRSGPDVAIRATRGMRTASWRSSATARTRDCERSRPSSVSARLLGTVTGQRKADLLAAADVFVLPSIELASGRSEGSPHALLEALSMGLPAVASDVGGVRELVEDGVNGLLVEPGRPESLGAALRTLHANDTMRARMSGAARARADQYRWSALGPRIEQLLGGARYPAASPPCSNTRASHATATTSGILGPSGASPSGP